MTFMKKTTLLMAALLCGAWCATAQTAENGYEYVDLGLSVKWAACNVGATTPEGYGDYFAWGETTAKEMYNWNTYKWATATYDAEGTKWTLETLNKYNTDDSYGTIDNKTVLDLADDAARANRGGAWRMPTYEEWRELINNCTWTWTTLNDINGFEVKGSNGNAIFLPAAGYRNLGDLDNAGSRGYYWSSSLGTSYSYEAWNAFFNSDYIGGIDNNRYYGFSVRAVVKESGSTTALQPATAAVNVYTTAGRIVCEGEFRIYDMFGRDVTRLNGSLQGVYVVKTDNAAVKVVVR